MRSKGHIEVFTAGCSSCERTVAHAFELASSGPWDVQLWDASLDGSSPESDARMRRYAIGELPAIVVDGELLACCKGDR